MHFRSAQRPRLQSERPSHLASQQRVKLQPGDGAIGKSEQPLQSRHGCEAILDESR